MNRKIFAVAPLLGAAGVAIGLAAAPVAAAADPCRDAVSSSRCLGPTGVDGFQVPGSSVQNGPYGPWGSMPPLG